MSGFFGSGGGVELTPIALSRDSQPAKATATAAARRMLFVICPPLKDALNYTPPIAERAFKPLAKGTI
jgi:hypothetical protein